MPPYVCDGCWEDIPVLKARIHCLECEDYDFCANCFVVKRFSKTHTAKHKTSLEERSGLMPRAEGDPISLTTSPASVIVPTPRNSSPPAYISAPATVYSPVRPAGTTSLQSSNHVSPNTIIESPVMIQSPQQPGAILELGNWQPLFDGTQPTQMMADLLTAIFICLDVTGTRLLAPEQYSSFLEVQGYSLDENVWKRNVKQQYGYNAEDIADFELRTAYKNFSIDHTLHPRHTTSLNTEMLFQPQLSPISGGRMPMLSLRGFIDITSIETLGEPTVGWQRLNLAKQFYEVWPEWGHIPRRVVPNYPPQELLDRVARISAYAQRQVAERQEARRAQEGWNPQMIQNTHPLGVVYGYH